jgi:D-glycero-D-manno-heptose 1,7-bisphosphate phosphatase
MSDLGRRALFLDRDGTVIEDEHYLRDPALIRFLPGALPALRAIAEAGYALVVVSNQSGVARGLITRDELARVHEAFAELLRAAGTPLDGAYYCEHGPDDGCACRKPKPGLIQRAIAELNLDPSLSYMIGDKERDCEAGLAAGCRALWLQPATPATSSLRTPTRAVAVSSWAEVVAVLTARSPLPAA